VKQKSYAAIFAGSSFPLSLDHHSAGAIMNESKIVRKYMRHKAPVDFF
jgi:hypothetical protein